MKFEKRNHHYVPQYWQRGFRGSNGHLYGRFGSDIRPVSPRTIMQSDWLYTVFDDQWNPSDALEDALSAVEAKDAKLFQRLHIPGYVTKPEDRDQLCAVLALQACRHPDVLGRGHRRSQELGKFLADAHSMTYDTFKNAIAAFGVAAGDAYDCYVVLRARTPQQLQVELADLLSLSPQSPQLPVQDALRAMEAITAGLKPLDLTLLDAPPGYAFVLGDTPLPQADLHLGFSVPLSKSLAVLAGPASISPATLGALPRRFARAAEVDSINRTQRDNAFEVVVGPSASLLATI
ncbi:DUF4238 domain-containing protein [Lysobacter enzymogenes]|uniref:DUF4238 domain-containing protein n=1 Tax=Lysobacter enzymogenes TaxID=69 RepID=A0A3N2RK89_LYSEN|nr:DUF4238 domain-containing protein [Lysobacter enzymogenes]ROU07885.1 DUF4238 domain-containing protein [Lysobacter enzymogenes]